MTLINQTPVPTTNVEEPKDFFQENIVYIIGGILLLILLLVLFFNILFTKSKPEKPVLQFIPFYVKRN